jgi:Archaeal/vacuolar-type H+-ATPase subunit F
MKGGCACIQKVESWFSSGGVHEAFICETLDDAKQAMEICLKNSEIGVILVSKPVARMIPEMIREAKTSPRMIPVISIIPDIGDQAEVCGGTA